MEKSAGNLPPVLCLEQRQPYPIRQVHADEVLGDGETKSFDLIQRIGEVIGSATRPWTIPKLANRW